MKGTMGQDLRTDTGKATTTEEWGMKEAMEKVGNKVNFMEKADIRIMEDIRAYVSIVSE